MSAANAPDHLGRARKSITSAVDLGATAGDVMLTAVLGLRGHDHPVSPDRADARRMAALYPHLLGSQAEGEPTIAALMGDDEPVTLAEQQAADAPPAEPRRLRKPEPHRRAMTLRLPPVMGERLEGVALALETSMTSLIIDALGPHLDHLEAEMRAAS